MSFILDALRKSDQTRQTTVLPAAPSSTPGSSTMSTVPSFIAPEMRTSFRWYWPVVIVLLSIVSLLGWWQLGSPNGSPKQNPATPLPTQSQVIASTPSAIQPSITRASSAPPTPASASTKSTPRIKQLDGSPAAPSAPGTPHLTTTAPQAASPRSPSTPHSSLPSPPPPREVPLPSTSNLTETENELPPNLLAELPKISVAAHSYSQKPKASFIFANDRMLHEGDSLSPGLRLERITNDGMILDYKGYRFRRGLQP